MKRDFGEVCSTKYEKNALEVISSIGHDLVAANAAKDEWKASAPWTQFLKEQKMDLFATVAEVSDIADYAINMALRK